MDRMICGRCNRVLRTVVSREKGYGPVCLRKVEAARLEDEKAVGKEK